MKAIYLAFMLIYIINSEVVKPTQPEVLDKSDQILEDSKPIKSQDLDMQQDFMNEFKDMFNELPKKESLDNVKAPVNSQRGLQTNLVTQAMPTPVEKSSAEDNEMDQMKMMQDMMDNMKSGTSLDNLKNTNLSQDIDVSNNINLEENDKDLTKSENLDTENKNPKSENNIPDLKEDESLNKTVSSITKTSEMNQTPEKTEKSPLDDYTPIVFEKPLAKSYEAARKLEDDDKMEDIEKRLFSIEDKIDHLLMHAGHELTPQKMTWTPWGMHIMPNYHNPESMHQKLSMVDHLMGHPMTGGMGMMGGHMGMGLMGAHMGMGMMGHPMAMGTMGLGHANPWGYGLDHVGGGFNNFSSLGYGRRASYSGSSNPYYTGNGSII